MDLHLLYDADGELQGVYTDDNETWMFVKNLQGDVVGYTSVSTGWTFTDFTYDAYGNYTVYSSQRNPFEKAFAVTLHKILNISYRGYIEVPFGEGYCFYLGSRFYSPELGRFLNADIHQDTMQGVVGTNMFAYCNNNPVMMVDPRGESASQQNDFISVFVNIFIAIKKILKILSLFPKTQDDLLVNRCMDLLVNFNFKGRKPPLVSYPLFEDGIEFKITDSEIKFNKSQINLNIMNGTAFTLFSRKVYARFAYFTVEEWLDKIRTNIWESLDNTGLLNDIMSISLDAYDSIIEAFGSGKVSNIATIIDGIVFLCNILDNDRYNHDLSVLKEFAKYEGYVWTNNIIPDPKAKILAVNYYIIFEYNSYNQSYVQQKTEAFFLSELW